VDRIADILVIMNPLARIQPAITKATKLAQWFDALVVKPTDFARHLPF
jgi:hypothetical protein